MACERKTKACSNSGLAELLDFWVNDSTVVDRRELVTLVLETVRDDIPHARTRDGRSVTDPGSIAHYLNEQITELRRLAKNEQVVRAPRQPTKV